MEEVKLKNDMQYWYSKYCNSIMRPERDAYLNVYNALKAVYDLMYEKKQGIQKRMEGNPYPSF